GAPPRPLRALRRQRHQPLLARRRGRPAALGVALRAARAGVLPRPADGGAGQPPLRPPPTRGLGRDPRPPRRRLRRRPAVLRGRPAPALAGALGGERGEPAAPRPQAPGRARRPAPARLAPVRARGAVARGRGPGPATPDPAVWDAIYCPTAPPGLSLGP